MSKIQCLIVDDEEIAREILATHLKKLDDINIVGHASNAIEAVKIMGDTKVDVLFLDIHMPEINGLSFAKNISKKTSIVFTTAHREYALEGFELQAFDYLLKPISFERILKTIIKYKENYTPNKVSDYIFIKSDRKNVKITIKDITYIESYGDYLKIHLHKGETKTLRESLSKFEKQLSKKQFLRTHRSFIVSMDKISLYTNEYIEIGNKAIPIGRNQKENVIRTLKQYHI